MDRKVKEVTYTPLGKNKCRCNIPPYDVVSRHRIRSHRRILANQLLGTHKLKRKKEKPVELQLSSVSNIKCLRCSKMVWAREGLCECPNCGKKYMITFKVLSAPLQISGFGFGNFAVCPYCQTVKHYVERGSTRCYHCERDFLIV